MNQGMQQIYYFWKDVSKHRSCDKNMVVNLVTVTKFYQMPYYLFKF